MNKITFNETYGLHDAVISGRKTMTRRAVSQRLLVNANLMQIKGLFTVKDYLLLHAPYQLDDVVAIAQRYSELPKELLYDSDDILRISQSQFEKGWNNKMFVKAELMLHHIRITDVRVEPLQNISDEDCLKEGVKDFSLPNCNQFGILGKKQWAYFDSPRQAFSELIDKISGKGTWERNPLVYVYEFELID